MKTQGKDIIRGIVQAAKQLDHDVTFVHLEDYDMTLAQLMAVGVDLWLNMPQPAAQDLRDLGDEGPT